MVISWNTILRKLVNIILIYISDLKDKKGGKVITIHYFKNYNRYNIID